MPVKESSAHRNSITIFRLPFLNYNKQNPFVLYFSWWMHFCRVCACITVVRNCYYSRETQQKIGYAQQIDVFTNFPLARIGINALFFVLYFSGWKYFCMLCVCIIVAGQCHYSREISPKNRICLTHGMLCTKLFTEIVIRKKRTADRLLP